MRAINADALRRARSARGFTVEALAASSGFPCSTLYALERDGAPVARTSRTVVDVLAWLLGVDAETLTVEP